MSNLIDRYVSEVVKKIPERDREDVKRELTSNVYDMLPENADEHQIIEVINQLGSPNELAKGYLKNPQYLISPNLYYDYIDTLKKVVPLAAGVFALVGLVLALVNTSTIPANESYVNVAIRIISDFFAKVFSFGISGALQATFWVTIGFIIAERVGYQKEVTGEKWTVDKLPKTVSSEKYSIKLSDSITELVLTIAFSVIFFMFLGGQFPSIHWLIINGHEIINIFTSEFLWAIGYCVIATGITTIISSIFKIVMRRWTPAVCSTVIANGIVSIIASVYISTRTNVFSGEFLNYLETAKWNKFDITRFLDGSTYNPLLIIVMLIVIIVTTVEITRAVIKTIKATNSEKEYLS